MNLVAIVLAAGKGTRMKSARAKVLHEVAGRPMIEHPVSLARAVGATRTICVLGHQAESVEAALAARFGPIGDTVEVALQTEQRGTGHAVAMAAPLLAGHAGKVLILYGDTPLLTHALLARLLAATDGKRLGLVTMRLPDPTGYGRIVRDGAGHLARIVEEKDASADERRIDEGNAGIYCVDAAFLVESLATLRADNAQGELYLTDVAARAAALEAVATVEGSLEEVMGVNDKLELSRADKILRRRILDEHMRAGVTVHDPDSCLVEPAVRIAADAEIGPSVQLRGATTVGAGARIDAGCVITDAAIADEVHLKPYCVVADSRIDRGAEIGPFAHLRPGSDIGASAKIGNFVETKKTRLGAGAKASHLSYLGDAEIGAKANIGCGTITCNYDGYRKFRTVIGEGAFIGSDTQLVAPVTVGAHAVVAAGTTVTKDVPDGALAISRAPQVAVPGYADRKRALEAARAGKPGAK